MVFCHVPEYQRGHGSGYGHRLASKVARRACGTPGRLQQKDLLSGVHTYEDFA